LWIYKKSWEKLAYSLNNIGNYSKKLIAILKNISQNLEIFTKLSKPKNEFLM
jgi:hypothetical protein